MLTGLKSSDLLKLKHNLQEMTEIVDVACSTRSRMIEYETRNSVDKAEFDSRISPESYYHFKYLQYGVSIVTDYFIYNDFKRSKSSDRHYHICFYNIRPDWLIKSQVYSFSNNNYNFGNFTTLDEAKLFFCRCCIDVMYELHKSLRPLQNFLGD